MELRPAAKRTLSRTLRLRELVRRERNALREVPMPLARRLELWCHGFTSESGALYQFTDHDRGLYVSDLAYALRAPLVNGVVNPTLDDKVLFFHTMRSMGAPTPHVHALVFQRGVAWFDGPADGGGDRLLRLLEREGELVLKPARGGKGDGVHFVALAGGRILVDGEPCDEARLRGLLRPGTMLCERVVQGGWADAIFPRATNTLRLTTMWDLERGEPFVAKAGHRFGTARSAPVDNVARGGIIAPVDPVSGELGTGFSATHDAAPVWHSHHPDTGAAIAGVRVPGWHRVRDAVLELSGRLAHIPFIGWDVLLGDDGWWVIEGNHYVDPTIQVFGPFLADERVERFLREYGVVRQG